ncbi:MAG: CoA-binding protein [Candidatus Eremiobacteraeota bacterium]|nr:CoA-binding protein [Candidatus Eremiobacteraeota bacterium]
MLADLYVGKRLLQAAAQCCLHLVQANLRLFPIPWQAAQERASGLVSVLSRLDEQEEYDRIFKSTRTVAVVGISDKPERPGRYVPKYLRDHGFRLLGVTPAGRNPIAERTAPTLQDLEEPLDLVIFFRRSQALGDHLDDVLSLDPRPATVWLQEGISNELFAGSLRAVGINVVSDRCAMQEHRRLYPEGEEHL